MPQTKVVIVYSPGQARRRTVVIPHDDSQVPLHTRNIARGEAAVVCSLGLYRQIGPDALLERVLGRRRTSDHCAVVDGRGVVVAHVCADPLIDRHPDGVLHHDPGAVTVIGQGIHHRTYVAAKARG